MKSLYTIFVMLLLIAGCDTDDVSIEPSGEPAAHDHDNEGLVITGVQDAENAVIALSAETGTQLYTCGMHPHVVQEGPGFCPICAMELTPVKQSGSTEGLVEIDPVTIQNIGVRTESVLVEPLSRLIRTTGRFEMNEQGRHTVSLKIDGWIEKLYADYEGALVQEGQPLLELYSPDLVSTQEDFLLALHNVNRMREGSAVSDAQRLLEATRRRLAYWDLSDEQIHAMEERGEPQRTLTFYAPASGEVMSKNVTEGQQIKAGQALMQISDLSTTWLMVDVYEQDLAWIGEGTRARIELPHQPGRVFEGRIDYVYNMLNTNTRSATARVVLSNTEGENFRPGMYATVYLLGTETPPGPVIPDEAVIRTGRRELVILSEGDGRFRPQEVLVGLQAAGKAQILEGLEGGELIVTSAQFLIDSEARLKSAIGAMLAHNHGSGSISQEDTDLRSASVSSMLVDVRAADENRDGMVNLCLDTPHLLQDTPGSIPGCTGENQLVLVGVAQAILHDAGYTNIPVDPLKSDRNGDGVVYQSPMHWSVIKDAPGNCDICNMTLEEFTLEEARRNLEREGYRVSEGQ